MLGGAPPSRTLFETPEYPEWVWTAMSQGAGNEMVTCVKCASYRVVLATGADAGCHVRPLETGVEEGSYERISVRNTGGLPTRQSAKQQVRQPALHLAERCKSGCRAAGKRTWCQARILSSVETPEYLEWVWMTMSQGAGNEMITCVKCASYRVVLATGADAGCHVRPLETGVEEGSYERRSVRNTGGLPTRQLAKQQVRQPALHLAERCKSGCRDGGQRTWCQARVLASVETPEYPEWFWTAMSQDAGNEMVTCVKSVSYRVVLAAGADVGCHVRPRETGVEEGSYERISVRNTGGLPTRQSAKQQVRQPALHLAERCKSGCRAAGKRTWCQARVLSSGETPEYPEWVWTAMSQGAGNEMVTCVKCASYRVVLATGADAGCHVRPRETGAPNEGFHPWGGPPVCRFQGPPAPRNPAPSVPPQAGLRRRPQPAGRRPAPPGIRPHAEMRPLETAIALSWPSSAPAAEAGRGCGRGVVRRVSSSSSGCRGGGQRTWCQARVLSSGETPEYPEWVWTAMSQGAGNEMVTCVKCASYRVVLATGADAGCHVRPLETGVEEGSYERISVRNTGGLPTRQSAKQQVRQPALHLAEWRRSGCRDGGQRTWCQARVLASVETPEYPEWVWMTMSQGAGNEMVTCVKCASYRVVLATGADAGCHVRPLETGVEEGSYERISVRNTGGLPTRQSAKQQVRQPALHLAERCKSGCRAAGKRTWCQARVLSSVETPEYPEWVLSWIAETTDFE